MDRYQRGRVPFHPQHQSSRPLRPSQGGQGIGAVFNNPPIHGPRDTALNPAASTFISQSPHHQTATSTPSGQTTPRADAQSGQATPRALAQTSAIHPHGQLHPGHGQIAPLPTRYELEQQIRFTTSGQFTDSHSWLQALQSLQTQVLGFMTTKGREKAAIDAQLEQEQRQTGRNSHHILVMLLEERRKRQEMFDMYARKFIELGEAIDRGHGDLCFGPPADPFLGL